MINIELSTAIANCTNPSALQNLMAGNNIYITAIKKLGNNKSKVTFAYHDSELKAFTVLVDDSSLT